MVLGTIPFKGQVLNQLAAFWFEQTADLAPNHVLSRARSERDVARECKPLPVELVMRAYLTGVTSTSIWKAYEKGARTFCGHALPDGMRRTSGCREPLLTPSTKADKGDHDESVSRDELLAHGRAVDAASSTRRARCARALFAAGQARRREARPDPGRHQVRDGPSRPTARSSSSTRSTRPTRSRYWYADDYEARLARGEEPRSLDKEYVRRWLGRAGLHAATARRPSMPDDVRIEAARRYIALYEMVTGSAFVPDTERAARPHPPQPRRLTARARVAVAVVELGAAGPLTRARIVRLARKRGREIAPGAALAEGTEAVVLIGRALVEPTCGPPSKRLAEEGAPVLALGAACAWACAAGLLPGGLAPRGFRRRRRDPPADGGTADALHGGDPRGARAAVAGRPGRCVCRRRGSGDASARGQVLLRYCDEAGGLAPTSNVAGLCSERGNVVAHHPRGWQATRRGSARNSSPAAHVARAAPRVALTITPCGPLDGPRPAPRPARPARRAAAAGSPPGRPRFASSPAAGPGSRRPRRFAPRSRW